jgi:hypothetical protein
MLKFKRLLDSWRDSMTKRNQEPQALASLPTEGWSDQAQKAIS